MGATINNLSRTNTAKSAHVEAGSAQASPEPVQTPRQNAHPHAPSTKVERQHRTSPFINAKVNTPLAGAFGGGAPLTQKNKTAPYTGPILDAKSLGQIGDAGESVEEAILEQTGGKAAIVPYGGFDARKTPVVLVHGLPGAAASFVDIAEKLKAEGFQVLVLMYDESGLTTPDSGKQMAASLRALKRDYYPGTKELMIVGHCMGAVVTRCALNELQQPGWLNGGVAANDPMAGFSRITVRAIDTPWYGFAGESKDLPGPIRRVISAVVHFFFWLFGFNGAFEMRASSEMFEKLRDVPLDKRVDFHNIWAADANRAFMWNLPQLPREKLIGLVRFLRTGKPPKDVGLANYAAALREDSHFTALRRDFLATADGVTDGEAMELLKEAYLKHFPAAPGDHVSLLYDDPGNANDVADRLVGDLRSRVRYVKE